MPGANHVAIIPKDQKGIEKGILHPLPVFIHGLPVMCATFGGNLVPLVPSLFPCFRFCIMLGSPITEQSFTVKILPTLLL